MTKGVKIGNAQGFWGDRMGAPAMLASQVPDLDYLTLDYLSELSLSIMAIQREKDPHLGYAKDFLDVITSLIPLWKKGSQVKVISNAGGLNPKGCASVCKKILDEAGCDHLKIGVVSGDDVLTLLKSNPNNPLYHHLDTQEPLNQIEAHLMTANAYLGAKPIVQALLEGVQIVITGRVADPSLTVAPCVAYHQWNWSDYHLLAGATLAGHLIECGTQLTGGISTRWLEIEDPSHLGFPVAEVDVEGRCIVSKPEGTSGRVSLETVKEQLLYEIGDPDCYISPDVVVSLLSVQVEEKEKNRVHISGAKGKPPPSTYKVCATYKDGYKSEGLLAIFGPESRKKAYRCGEVILQRIKDAGYEIERSLLECLGTGDLVPGVFQPNNELRECLLRIAVADHRRKALECFSKEIAPLVTSGPQGVTGYTSGRPLIRPVFSYWPCLVEVSKLHPHVEILGEKR